MNPGDRKAKSISPKVVPLSNFAEAFISFD
jgi:hypothetical protein